MLDHDLHLLADIIGVQAHPLHNALQGLRPLNLSLVPLFAAIGQFEGQLVGRVVLQHIEDKALFNGLTHGIDVEGRRQIVRSHRLVRLGRTTEQLKGLGLGRGGEGHIGDALFPGPLRHLGGQQVLGVDFAPVIQGFDLFGR